MTFDLQTLTELSTLEHLVSTQGVEALLAAFDTALVQTPADARVPKAEGPTVSARTLRLLRRAVELDADFLREHPEALFQSLYNRLRWYDAPDAAAHYDTQGPGPWENPDAHLHRLAALWRQQREAAGGAAWVESLRPLSGSLDGGDLSLSHDERVEAVAFSPCGKKLATTSSSDEKNIHLWDVATGKCLRVLEGHDIGEILGLAWSPDGRKLASGSRSHDARVWDVETGELLYDFPKQEGRVTSVAFSPDGKVLAVGNLGWRVHLFDMESGEKIRTLKGHQQSVLCVAFHPSGRQLASAASDDTVRIWDMTTGAQVASIATNATPRSIAFSPDGERLAYSVLEGVAIAETRHWTPVEGLWGRMGCGDIAWLGTTHLAMLAPREVLVLDAHTRDTVWSRTYYPSTAGNALAFSPDRKHFALTESTRVLVSEIHAQPPPTLKSQGQPVKDLLGAPEAACLIVKQSTQNSVVDARGQVREFSDSSMGGGQKSWSMNRDGTLAAFPIVNFHEEPRRRAIQLFDLVSLTPAKELTAKPLEGRDTASRMLQENVVAFSPDGALLAGTVELGVVRLWSIPEGRLLHTLKGPANPVTTLEFTPDGALLLTGLAEASHLLVHDVKTGALVHNTKVALKPTPTYAVATAAPRLAVGRSSGELALFELPTGTSRFIQVSNETVVAVAISSDGTRVAASDMDSCVHVYDATTGDELYQVPHPELPYTLAIEAPFLVTMSEDHHVRFFDLATGAPRADVEASTDPQDVIRRRYWEGLGDGPVAFHRRMDPTPFAHFQDAMEACYILRDGIAVGQGRTQKDFLYVLRIHEATSKA
ncbi:WD40 repeat domain-containing protein [Myxococcus stipitatus]|uniref:WD40 repeat domain-containing protein n=1 Tax=Myxococcus stipitatus TaxID=83455 RepID=UPI003144F1C1